MRGKNVATPKGNQKKSGSPGPSKPRDRQGKGVKQKGHVAADVKKKSDVNPDDVPVCEDCGTPIGGDVSALQCDNCDSIQAWKCTSCLGVSNELYQELMSNTDLKVLSWMQLKYIIRKLDQPSNLTTISTGSLKGIKDEPAC